MSTIKSDGLGVFMQDLFAHDYSIKDAYKSHEKLSAKYRDKFHVDRSHDIEAIERVQEANNSILFNGRRRHGHKRG